MVECRTCDREVAGSTPARVCCVPTPTQRAIPPGSVNEFQRKLGVNGHTTRGLAASAGVRLRAKGNGDHDAALSWPLRVRKNCTFFIQQASVWLTSAWPRPRRSGLRLNRLDLKVPAAVIVEPPSAVLNEITTWKLWKACCLPSKPLAKVQELFLNVRNNWLTIS